ncbi:MAG: hypothetical protein Q8T13_23360 [Acidobacteriota bacterium]|nr:hypothetical protein [Acidobacteriota bacterium]
MRVLALLGACILAAVSGVSAQSPTLASQRPLTVKFVETTVSEAVDFLARQSKITIRFDDEVPASVRDGRLEPSPMSLVNVQLAAALQSIANSNGLAFEVIDPTTVLIRIRAREQGAPIKLLQPMSGDCGEVR